MSPRKRKAENRSLPARWRHYHGAYYYRVPRGLEHLWDGKTQFRLGKTIPEAYRVWAERLQHPDKVRTMGELLDRYACTVLPAKAPKTQREQAPIIQRLKNVFGELALTAIRPSHVYHYVDARTAKTAAIREIEVLRHSLTKAVEWGLLARHPLHGQVNLRGRKPRPRDRYVEDWEVIEMLRIASRRKRGSVVMIQAYIRIKLLTALRRGDLLRLRTSDLSDIGIHVQPRKTVSSTGKRLVIEWTPELRAAVDLALAVRPKIGVPWLFCNASGECYYKEDGTANGWDSMWQRFVRRVLTETAVTARFTEHDLRAKCASDATTLEHARQLLAHADTRTTSRYYRRKAERVKPLR